LHTNENLFEQFAYIQDKICKKIIRLWQMFKAILKYFKAIFKFF